MPKRPHDEDSSLSSDPISSRLDKTTFTSFDETPHQSKYIETSENSNLLQKAVMKCSLPPHIATLSFFTFEEFEVHYAKAHANRCPECHKNFPTEHFLGLHIEENHDPLAEAKRAKGEKTYRCFVEGCDKICIDPHKRRMHLIDKHAFPKNYDFHIVNTGIDKKNSILRSKHQKSASTATRRPKSNLHHHHHHESTPQEPTSAKDDNNTAQSSVAAIINPSSSIKQPIPQTQTPNPSPPPPPPPPNNNNPNDNDIDIATLTSTLSSLTFIPPSVRSRRGRGRGGRRSGGLSRS